MLPRPQLKAVRFVGYALALSFDRKTSARAHVVSDPYPFHYHLVSYNCLTNNSAIYFMTLGQNPAFLKDNCGRRLST